ncbi:MAG: hypothetical protein AAGE18_13470 [Pseudomonadota bacterium]
MKKALFAAFAAVVLTATPALSGFLYNTRVDETFRVGKSQPLGGVIPVVLVGQIPNGLTAEQFTAMLRAPGYAPRTGFVPSDGPVGGTRIVFAFGSSNVTSLCRGPSAGGSRELSAAFCVGSTAVSTATLRPGGNMQRDLNQVMRALIFRPEAGGSAD